MFKYIIRRTFYSVWVIVGVLLLTFVLFNLASGDPAGAILGKNATAEEIDSLRRDLGSDLPLFWGRLCTTEAFGKNPSAPPGSQIKRQFPCPDIVAVLKYQNKASETICIADSADSFQLPNDSNLVSCSFFRKQKNPWNSQFLRSISELISIKKDFPYLSFFNFGNTINTREPVTDVLKRGVVPSLMLMLPIFVGELLCGVVLALLAVAFSGKWLDRMLLLSAVITMSLSYLVMIIFGQWYMGYYLEWFPLWGFGSIEFFILPVIIGIISGFGNNLRFFRTVFADELQKEYLRTALAKGNSSVSIYGKHLLKNALIQVITKAGASLPFLFTGSLLLESFFGIPGLGFAGMEALMNSDIQLLKALVLFSAILFVVINLLTDIAYAWADPRIKLE